MNAIFSVAMKIYDRIYVRLSTVADSREFERLCQKNIAITTPRRHLTIIQLYFYCKHDYYRPHDCHLC